MVLPDRHRKTTWSGRRESAARGPISFLSCHLPWPPVSGGRRRELELIKLLRPVSSRSIWSSCPRHPNRMSPTPTCWRTRAVKLAVFAAEPAADTATSDLPAQISRHRSAAATNGVAEILARGTVDLVHVEGFYLMQHVPESAEVPILLVEQNIEFDLAHQRATVGCDPDARFGRSVRAQSRRGNRIVAGGHAARDGDPQDREVIEAELTVLTLRSYRTAPITSRSIAPASTACSAPGLRSSRSLPTSPTPRKCASTPRGISAATSCRRFGAGCARRAHLAGRQRAAARGAGPSRRDGANHRPGSQPSAVSHAADVMVCPLRIGGGIKVKTIEALARGKAIVSTPIGAQAERSGKTCAADRRAAARVRGRSGIAPSRP